MSTLEGLYERLPRLAESQHEITSPPTDDYNCVGWVFRELKRYYAPGIYWPVDEAPEPEGDNDLAAYVALFEARGYVLCHGPDLEEGFLKIAIYARDDAFHHVAKQLPNGEWSSKIGEAHDLRHASLAALEGSLVFYNSATATVFMKRPYDPSESFNLELNGLV